MRKKLANQITADVIISKQKSLVKARFLKNIIGYERVMNMCHIEKNIIRLSNRMKTIYLSLNIRSNYIYVIRR